MSINLDRKTLPQLLLAGTVFLLYLPVGVMYAGLLLFIVAWLASAEFKTKWNTTRQSALFQPIVAMLMVIALNFVFLSQGNKAPWPALVHYLIFFFLLLFISLGVGAWQQLAKKLFIRGAFFGATLFYLARLGFLPDWEVFRSYAVYSGNKSIALSIFLAIAAAWLLNDLLSKDRSVQDDEGKTWLGVAGYCYIAVAELFLATSRTGMLLFFVLSFLVLLPRIRMNLRGMVLIVSVPIVVGLTWQFSPHLRERTLITVQSIVAFSQGEMVTGQGNRLQFVQKTGEMILEKPILGHGVGSWLEQYPSRARGLETADMSTPHNDYLLYAAELGAFGLLALLLVIVTIFRIAIRAGGAQGTQLLVVAVALLIGATFNAILRDWKFGLPMMMLLAVSLSDGSQRKQAV